MQTTTATTPRALRAARTTMVLAVPIALEVARAWSSRRLSPETLSARLRAAASAGGQGLAGVDPQQLARWGVRGHQRLQAYGPAWSQRRPIWIAAHSAARSGTR